MPVLENWQINKTFLKNKKVKIALTVCKIANKENSKEGAHFHEVVRK